MIILLWRLVVILILLTSLAWAGSSKMIARRTPDEQTSPNAVQ